MRADTIQIALAGPAHLANLVDIGISWRIHHPVPAQQRLGPRWYTGSADAIFQSMNLITDELPEYIVVFGADHVYRMDPSQMVEAHIASGADVTVAGIRVPRAEAVAFGCIDSDASGKITRFLEKPADPPGTPPTIRTRPSPPWATTCSPPSSRRRPARRRRRLRLRPRHGRRHHPPRVLARDTAYVYDFKDNQVPGATERDKGYWRDVGTLDAFYEAHMDLVSVHPIFNLYNGRWPIRGETHNLPPAKFVQSGVAEDSVVGSGCIISGGTVRNSVLSSNVIVEDGAIIEGSVLMPGVRVGKGGAVVRRAILDKNVVVGDGEQLGVDPRRRSRTLLRQRRRCGDGRQGGDSGLAPNAWSAERESGRCVSRSRQPPQRGPDELRDVGVGVRR